MYPANGQSAIALCNSLAAVWRANSSRISLTSVSRPTNCCMREKHVAYEALSNEDLNNGSWWISARLFAGVPSTTRLTRFPHVGHPDSTEAPEPTNAQARSLLITSNKSARSIWPPHSRVRCDVQRPSRTRSLGLDQDAIGGKLYTPSRSANQGADWRRTRLCHFVIEP